MPTVNDEQTRPDIHGNYNLQVLDEDGYNHNLKGSDGSVYTKTVVTEQDGDGTQFVMQQPATIQEMAYHWAEKRYDYDGGYNLIYTGLHTDLNALTSDNKWVIYKTTYSGSFTTREQINIGAWDSREVLF